MRTLRITRPLPDPANPDQALLRSGGALKRCGVCGRLWPAYAVLLEDEQELCPSCVDVRYPTFIAEATAAGAERVARMSVPRPQISQMPVLETSGPAVATITDSNGSAVTCATPLRMLRTVAATLLLTGIKFSASDVISYSTGISNASAIVRTATLTTLTLIADVSMTAGDHYHLTFNNIIYRDVFSVR